MHAADAGGSPAQQVLLQLEALAATCCDAAGEWLPAAPPCGTPRRRLTHARRETKYGCGACGSRGSGSSRMPAGRFEGPLTGGRRADRGRPACGPLPCGDLHHMCGARHAVLVCESPWTSKVAKGRQSNQARESTSPSPTLMQLGPSPALQGGRSAQRSALASA